MKTDILIIGAGLVGSSVILALQKKGYDITLLEAQSLDPEQSLSEQKDKAQDMRTYSLTPTSQVLLNDWGVWSHLDSKSTLVTSVRLSEKGRLGSCTFKASEANIPALAYLVGANTLKTQVQSQALHVPHLTYFDEVSLLNIQQIKELTQVFFTSKGTEHKIDAKLCIVSDGIHSTTRQLLNLATEKKEYQQSAMIFSFSGLDFKPGQAQERYLEKGLIAWLPLNEKQATAIFISRSQDMAALQSASSAELCLFIQNHLPKNVGSISQLNAAPQCFPLCLNDLPLSYLTDYPNMIFFGDARYRFHPIAAQGLNLSLRDAFILSRLLPDKTSNIDVNFSQIVQVFFRQREKDFMQTKSLTDRLAYLHDTALSCLMGFRSARGLGFSLLSHFPPLKQKVLRSFLGENLGEMG